ncbi:MAG: hypothetical protein HC923_02240 [Myxococcales bacterium]|nr:hypothetical protein [Myxococcales bacterium]
MLFMVRYPGRLDARLLQVRRDDRLLKLIDADEVFVHVGNERLVECRAACCHFAFRGRRRRSPFAARPFHGPCGGRLEAAGDQQDHEGSGRSRGPWTRGGLDGRNAFGHTS